jgi:general transcriptional corepressor TUP1
MSHWKAHDQDIYALDVSSDAKFIVTGSGDCTVKIWDYSGRQIHCFTIKDGITSVAFSPDCRTVAASCLDNTVHVWNTTSASMIATLTGHIDATYFVTFNPSGSQIISVSLDRTVRIWELDPTLRGTSNEAHFGGSCTKAIDGHAVSNSFLSDF